MKGFRKLGEQLFNLGLTQRLGLGQRHTAGGDATAPTVVITCAQSDNTSVTPLNFTFMLSEVATDFAIGDITVGGVGGTKSNFAGSPAQAMPFPSVPALRACISFSLLRASVRGMRSSPLP